MGELLSKPTQPRGRQAPHRGRPGVAPGREGWRLPDVFLESESRMWRVLTGLPPFTGSTLHSGVYPPTPPTPPTLPAGVLEALPDPRHSCANRGFQTTCCAKVHAGRQNAGDVCTGDRSSVSEEENGIKGKAWPYRLLSDSKIHSGAE